jgi:hypothetical protein
MKKQRTHCAPAIWQAIWAVQVSDSATPPPTTRTFLWDGEHSRRVSVLLGEVLRCLKEVGLEPTLLKGTSPRLMLVEDKGFSEVTCAGIRESGRAIKLYSAVQCSILLWSLIPQTTLLLTADEIYGSHTITSEIFTKQATRIFVHVDWIAPETCPEGRSHESYEASLRLSPCDTKTPIRMASSCRSNVRRGGILRRVSDPCRKRPLVENVIGLCARSTEAVTND